MKTRKIVSVVLALTLALAMFTVPVMAATHEVTITEKSDPFQEILKKTGTTNKAQSSLAVINIDDKELNRAWLVPGVQFRVTFEYPESNENVLAIRFMTPESANADDKCLTIYRDGQKDRMAGGLEDLGNNTYVQIFSYDEMVKDFTNAEWNSSGYSSVEDVFANASFIYVRTRNTGSNTVTIKKFEVVTPDSGAAATETATETTTEANPKTGDSLMIVFAAAAFVIAVGGILLAMKKLRNEN